MKKFVAAIIAVAVLVPMFAMSVFAAEPPKMFAKAGAATIDGVISEGEYGEAVVINGDNAITWTGGTLETEVSYYFAWTEEALYVATSIPSAAVDTGLTLQVNFNPGNLIPDGYPGLFFGMNYGGEESLEVTQHNHGTKLAESLNEGAVADITESVEAIAKEDGTNTIFEVAIPVDFFKVTSLEGVSFEDFTLSETTVLSASPFMVLNGHGYTITGVDNMEGNSWTVKDLNLGTLTLLNENGEAPESPSETPSETPSESPSESADPTDAPQDNDNPSTFDLGIVSLAAVALSSVVAVKKRK